MKKVLLFIVIPIVLVLSGCDYFSKNHLQNVGMLFESTIENNAWNEKGYEGLLEIEKKFKTDIFYKENVKTESEVAQTVGDFVKEGVNLIIGHGNIYGSHFAELTKSYPEVHFIYMNGDIYNSNITSLNIDSHALGFFGGMVAGEMTKNNQIGVIAVYAWQPELEGIYEGIKYQNPEAEIDIEFVNDWDDEQQALKIYESFRKEGVDVIFPLGNAYSKSVIQAAALDGIYSIGYIADQHELAPDYVLTSMIQHIDKLYVKVADDVKKQDIVGGIRSYNFHDEVIELGTFNEITLETFQSNVLEAIENYKKTNLLPNETVGR